MDTSQLLWGMIFGAIGLGYITYGKKQQAFIPLFSGIALCVYPYFVTNTYLIIATGIILMLLPKFIKI